jgi:transposase
VSNDVIRDVFYAGCAMRGEVLEAERRRFWHDDDKPEIVMSVGVDGASVTQVAQRHVISRQ